MIGRTISHYQITEKLGQGGMGVVYKAEDTRLGRTVALKFLPFHNLGSSEHEARFLREARAAAAMNHPAICTIHEIDQADGNSFIAMEFVEGQSLKERIAEGPLPVEDALDIALQIARGLVAAHREDIIHRDIKPANIMLDLDGRVKIVDFGLAKITGHSKLTQANQTLGTVAYMAPEQARGEQVDHRVDLWAMGVLLYEMLSSKTPYPGDYPAAIAYAILNQDPTPLEEHRDGLPDKVVAIIDQCMTREPADRYPDAETLVADLEALLGIGSAFGSGSLTYGRAALHSLSTGARLGFGAVVLVAGILTWMWVLPPARRAVESFMTPEEQRLAVLPFRTTSMMLDADDTNSTEALAAGLFETLTSNLARSESFVDTPFWVVPAGEILQRNIVSPDEARQVFDANLVVDGSIQIYDEGIRLTLNISNPRSKPVRLLRSKVIDFKKVDGRLLQDQAYDTILEMLDLTLRPQSQEVVVAGSTTRPDANAFYLQGIGYLQRYDREENIDTATNLFNRALEKDGNFALAHAGLARAYELKYNATREARWVDSALVRTQYALDLDDRVPLAYLTRGSISRKAGRLNDALYAYEQAIALDPTNIEAIGGLARVYLNLDKPAEAQQQLEQAIALKPSYWRSYDQLGYFFFRQGRIDEAVEQYQQALQLTPDNSWVISNLGTMAFLQERWDQAQTYYEKALQYNPRDYEIQANLGTVYFYLERYADAVQVYEKALEQRDTDYLVWSSLGDAYYWAPGQREKAEAVFRQTIQMVEEELRLRTRDPYLLAELASLHARLDEDDRARELLDRVVAFGSDDVGVALQVGMTFDLLEERDRAIDWIFRALPDERVYVLNSPWLADLRQDPRLRDRLSP